MSSSTNSNVLKRKNEDSDSVSDDISKKRVALDGEQIDESLKQEVEAKTAPAIGSSNSSDEEEYDPSVPGLKSPPAVDVATESNESKQASEEPEEEHKSPEHSQPQRPSQPVSTTGDESPSVSHNPVSSVTYQREKEDPTVVSFRMYCPVKEAGLIVGKKGEQINHIRDRANVKVFVSDNIKGVPERIVTVRGSAENVAKAFGLAVRAILDEPEDEASSINSSSYDLRLLIPHPLVGYIIGKQGSKFREIEENSAAKLKAAETPLPYSTDRILLINGVSDAIHIAVYYVAQVVLEHKDALSKQKIVFYNPANYQPNSNPLSTLTGMSPPVNNNMNMNTMGNMGNMSNVGGMNNNMNALSALNSLSSMMMPNNNVMMNPMANAPMGNPTMGNAHMGNSPMANNSMGMQNPQSPYAASKQPYNFQMMFQPSNNPQQNYNSRQPINAPPQQAYTDELGNSMVGEVLTHPLVPSGSGDKYNQDVFVANNSIGSVIGKGGNNIKQIRETSGCTYVKIEPDRGDTMMLGGGRGRLNMRKLTLTGSLNSINTAIYLINQRINTDKERNLN
ncbi:PAB1 binding protein [Yamadazyma tenuis]|uniref:K Homology domain-containing protein n=1 Tax=Candida tenuis (strain ATCC 10573 / BCRC 21748 / CBS 615 / JCM 9827 / NBRC 10315 / NRRL Y-1498 / VKM Y-70) TaxID=590646 RepID=G3B552_CANTC|nr:uncharacterized protein CANTEDRAFT_93908 [Yamadazyma tenuis ATCC 10573]EGV63139.1 hypothetical protein CANTEDRAFT_93908 [Yamadazyma tenuis ATCC 10573]WEJ97044.1 PAB1 binding protein [Yamadazyma tenuis]